MDVVNVNDASERHGENSNASKGFTRLNALTRTFERHVLVARILVEEFLHPHIKPYLSEDSPAVYKSVQVS